MMQISKQLWERSLDPCKVLLQLIVQPVLGRQGVQVRLNGHVDRRSLKGTILIASPNGNLPIRVGPSLKVRIRQVVMPLSPLVAPARQLVPPPKSILSPRRP